MDLSPLGPQAAPRRSLLTEERFAAALGEEAAEFLQVVSRVRAYYERGWVERDLYALYRQSTDLERYLDHHGASDNQSFSLLRELLARVRWLALANSTLVHLRGRLSVYPPTPDGWLTRRLVPELQSCLAQLGKFLMQGLEGLEAEWRCRHAPWPNVEPVQVAETPPRPVLAADLVPTDVVREEANQGEMKAAARWAWRVQRLFESLPAAFAQGAEDDEEAKQLLREHLREAQVREIQARAHNLQSDYDTQIRGSQDAKQDEVLPMLRGATSQGLHLFEAATALTHLMERHEGYARIPEARDSLQRLLPWEDFRLLIVNQLAKLAYESFEVASQQSVGLIERLTKPSFIELRIPDDVNLHARPLSLVVRVVNHFETPVEMEMMGQRASAASMMALLVLAGSHSECRDMRFHGDERVLVALKELVFAGIGERGMDALPQSLDFLRT